MEEETKTMRRYHSANECLVWCITIYKGAQELSLKIFYKSVFRLCKLLVFDCLSPESFAIYKKSCDNCPFEPYQFYSASCEETYGRPRRGIVTRNNEQLAICTDEFSDISPLTGGNVAFRLV